MYISLYHIQVLVIFNAVIFFRVKELKEELEVTRGRLNSAERNVASMDAQRKAALTDKIALTKQVSFCCHLRRGCK